MEQSSTLRLEIVSVLPDLEPSNAPAGTAGTAGTDNDPVDDTVVGFLDDTIVGLLDESVVAVLDEGVRGLLDDRAVLLPLLGIAVDELTRRLEDEVKLPPDAAKMAATDLAEMRATIQHGDAELARKMLAVFRQTYPQFRIDGR